MWQKACWWLMVEMGVIYFELVHLIQENIHYQWGKLFWSLRSVCKIPTTDALRAAVSLVRRILPTFDRCISGNNSSCYNVEVWLHRSLKRHTSAHRLDKPWTTETMMRILLLNWHFFFCFLRCASSVKHFQIGWDGSQFKFGMGSFSNISEFVEHFENKPLIGGDSGEYNMYYYWGQILNNSIHRMSAFLLLL